ncbi:hypothetical protein BKK54_03035 [Rodentibacter genomosp. 1]|uniref:Uncharacterized protein n=1 Tax=Rodentibacter genomosp. 1 TaxID=1908264 RepID=A0A1V3J8B2_9PAST|nr:hypothetical protein [Rodentibacter genomosp. 1]OOF51594.1 hypothetical protein BKK54_03035 [Rodentibacter genomosp. 1]
MEDKKYPRVNIDEKMIKYNLVSALLLFIFVVVFFNDIPETNFEKFLDRFLIKDRGIYSQIYPFQSHILSNLLMILPIVSAFFLAKKIKFSYLSEKELNDLKITIEKNIIKIILIKIAGVLALSLSIFMCIFFIYIDYAPLDEVAIKTAFFRDSFATLIFLPYVFYGCSTLLMMFLIILFLHPINFLKYQYKVTYDKKDKIRLLMKNKRKNGK